VVVVPLRPLPPPPPSREQVRPLIGTRLGTSAPSDMFSLMSENMNIVKQKSSPSLQRRVLSAVMVEVVYYSREMLADLMKAWDSDKSSLTLEYVRPPSPPPSRALRPGPLPPIFPTCAGLPFRSAPSAGTGAHTPGVVAHGVWACGSEQSVGQWGSVGVRVCVKMYGCLGA
jgi:hypothetical protein